MRSSVLLWRCEGVGWTWCWRQEGRVWRHPLRTKSPLGWLIILSTWKLHNITTNGDINYLFIILSTQFLLPTFSCTKCSQRGKDGIWCIKSLTLNRTQLEWSNNQYKSMSASLHSNSPNSQSFPSSPSKSSRSWLLPAVSQIMVVSRSAIPIHFPPHLAWHGEEPQGVWVVSGSRAVDERSS